MLTQVWAAESLQRKLGAQVAGAVVEVVPQIGSTNSVMVERVRQWAASDGSSGGAALGLRAHPSLWILVAEHQTEGRGRMGRVWHSSNGASLTFSVAMRLSPADWSGLSLAVGVALADALEPEIAWHAVSGAKASIQLKWPNDLVLCDSSSPTGGRKLGGVLIETVVTGSGRFVVVGVGLNIKSQPLPALETGFASLDEFLPTATAPATLDWVAPSVVSALLRFEADGFRSFAHGFSRRDHLLGRAVVTSLDGFDGAVATGADGRGALQLRLDDGRICAVSVGEVTVRPVATLCEVRP